MADAVALPMIDRPDAARLLAAVADTLVAQTLTGRDSEVATPCDGAAAESARYTLRVAANLCRILAREARFGPAAEAATVAELRELLGRNGGSIEDLNSALDEALRSGGAGLDSTAVHRVLTANVERRLAIARPAYRLASDPTTGS